MDEEEIVNGEYYAAKIELNGEDGYIDGYGMIQDSPDGATECATIADAKELVEKYKYIPDVPIGYSFYENNIKIKIAHNELS